MHGRTPNTSGTRQERKQRTREALLDAALEKLEQQSFSSQTDLIFNPEFADGTES